MIKNIPISLCIVFLITAVAVAFIIHWITIFKYKNPLVRLERSRGSYLGFTLLLVATSWLLSFKSGFYPHFTLISIGYFFSFIGDIFNLQFDFIKKRVKEPLVFGVLFFLVAQIFYITGFAKLIGVDILIKSVEFYVLMGVLILIPLIIFRLKVYSPKRPKKLMNIAMIYSVFLGTMTAVSLSGAILLGGKWILISIGAGFFLLSDAVMGSTSIKGYHPPYEFQVPWITYLLAQGFILFTYLLL